MKKYDWPSKCKVSSLLKMPFIFSDLLRVCNLDRKFEKIEKYPKWSRKFTN